MQRDLIDNVLIEQIIDPAVLTTTTSSSDIDMQGYQSLTIMVPVGTTADTWSAALDWNFVVYDADDDGSGSPDTYSVVEQQDVVGATVTAGSFANLINSATQDEAVYSIGYVGGKRWVYVALVVAGVHSSGTPMAAIAIKGNAGYAPITNT